MQISGCFCLLLVVKKFCNFFCLIFNEFVVYGHVYCNDYTTENFNHAWLIDLIIITVLGLCIKTSKLNLWHMDGAKGLIFAG